MSRPFVASGGHTPNVKVLRADEEWARRVIQSHLGVPVEQHDDDSSDSMHDLTIEYADRSAAVEVVAAGDAETIEFWNLANSSDGWQASGILGGWAVECSPTTRVKRLRRELPNLLASWEDQGTTSYRESLNRRTGGQRSGLATELGIKSAFQSETSFPGSIYLTVELPRERAGGMVADCGDPAAEWIGQFLREDSQRDVLSKLRSSSSRERHAFVVLPGFTTAPFPVFDVLRRDPTPLPLKSPSLPSEVTHVWLMSTWSAGSALYWSEGSGWVVVDKKSVIPSSEP